MRSALETMFWASSSSAHSAVYGCVAFCPCSSGLPKPQYVNFADDRVGSSRSSLRAQSVLLVKLFQSGLKELTLDARYCSYASALVLFGGTSGSCSGSATPGTGNRLLHVSICRALNQSSYYQSWEYRAYLGLDLDAALARTGLDAAVAHLTESVATLLCAASHCVR